MPTTDIHDASSHLAELIARAEAGEEIVIARDGKPAVRLVSVEPPKTGEEDNTPRVGGQWRGRIWMAPDFDDFTDELAEMFGMKDPG